MQKKNVEEAFCFRISKSETFSKSIAFKLIKKYGKGAVIQISTYLDPFTMLLFEGSSETGLFRH